MQASSDEPIRVVIIDSHTLVRAGLGLIVDNHPGMSVVGEAGESNEALKIVNLQKPDIILLILDSVNDIGSEIIPLLFKESNHSRIILVACLDETELNLSALKQGALGIVFKAQKPDVLIKAIQKVNEGEVWIERSLIANVLYGLANHKEPIVQDPETEYIAELTIRERDVIQLIGRGFKNKQIAEQLYLSETTVRHHLTSIYSKLGVKNRLELLIFANRHGFG